MKTYMVVLFVTADDLDEVHDFALDAVGLDYRTHRTVTVSEVTDVAVLAEEIYG